MSLVVHLQVDAKLFVNDHTPVISNLGQRAIYIHLMFAFPLHIAPRLMGGLYRDAVPYREMKNVLQCHCTTFSACLFTFLIKILCV